jgi:DtxR family Mn-dependent transcriptional regulator
MKISEPAEEILEKIWVFLEDNDMELISPEIELYDKKAVKELEDLKLIEYKENNIQLTLEGFEEAKKVIRRHRLAEKLLHDVLGLSGEDMETAACNFEHIMEGEVEESICTLLSHPKLCPHGKPIPSCGCSEGEPCSCTAALKEIIEKTVLPLTKLNKGHSGKIIYIKSAKRDNLHKILSIGVLPGREIKVIQTNPSHVFQMEHTQIAVDSGIAESIFVGNLK